MWQGIKSLEKKKKICEKSLDIMDYWSLQQTKKKPNLEEKGDYWFTELSQYSYAQLSTTKSQSIERKQESMAHPKEENW